MTKRKAEQLLNPTVKKANTSTDFVFYEPARKKKIQQISATKIGKRPIYRFFLDFDGQYFPLRCMLDLGSTSFVISPEATRAFGIPVIKRKKQVISKDVTGRQIKTDGFLRFLSDCPSGTIVLMMRRIMLSK